MNKSDGFVTKTIFLKDSIGDIVQEQINNNQLDITNLSPGAYTMEIHYSIAVPEAYARTITQLEEKYHISLTERERGILVLEPVVD